MVPIPCLKFAESWFLETLGLCVCALCGIWSEDDAGFVSCERGDGEWAGFVGRGLWAGSTVGGNGGDKGGGAGWSANWGGRRDVGGTGRCEIRAKEEREDGG